MVQKQSSRGVLKKSAENMQQIYSRTPTSVVPGVVACTCNPATLEAKFQNDVCSIPVGGNIPSIGGCIV